MSSGKVQSRFLSQKPGVASGPACGVGHKFLAETSRNSSETDFSTFEA